MLLRVVETTDGKYRGREFEVNLDPSLLPIRIPVEPGVNFEIDTVDQLPDGRLRFSNANYVAIAEVIG